MNCIENPRCDISAEYLRSILDYDTASGVFTWKRRPSISGQLNGRYAGKQAGNYSSPSAGGRGYVRIRIDTVTYLAHRLAWLWMTGKWPAAQIDHKDGVRHNNSWANLREAHTRQQRYNAAVKKNNRSGLKGVYRYRDGVRWQAAIRTLNGRKWLGLFETAEAAYAAYCAAANAVQGEFARQA